MTRPIASANYLAGPPQAPRGLSQRARWLVLGSVFTVIFALVAGLLVWQRAGEADQSEARAYLRPFESAVRALVLNPALRYQDAASGEDVTVTASGSRYGTINDGQGSGKREVLQAGERTFTRPGSPSADNPARNWDAGADGAAEVAKQLSERRPEPGALASQLLAALTALAGTKLPALSDGQSRSVDGTQALAANTSAGRLLITKDAPHKVLRLEPYSADEAEHAPKITDGPLAVGGSQALALDPVPATDVGSVFGELERRTKQLSNAVDSGISLNRSAAQPSVNCSEGGCSTTQSFTSSITTSAQARLVDGKITASLTGIFQIDGKPAGECVSPPASFPATAGGASGTLSCSAPQAGPMFAAIKAQKMAEAQARSRASGGQPVRYSVPYSVRTRVSFHAVATVEVTRLLEGLEREKESATCKPHSFPGATLVLLADGTHRPIRDIRAGDQVLATDPEQRITGPRPVTEVFTTDGDKEFTAVTVDTVNGPAGVTATENHPFWRADAKRWTKAGELRPGQHLLSNAGPPLRVSAVQHQRLRQHTYDLSVAEIHTYYVLAGGTPLLVHNQNRGSGNCNPVTSDQAKDIARFLGYTKKNDARSAGGTAIYFNKKPGPGQPQYITWDRTGHNGAVFKGSNSKNPFQSTKDDARDGSYALDIGPNGELRGLKWVKK